jgi:pyruvate dehydrogenase E2 component (dihydrolipoamide acetyltransferase)
MKVSREIPLEGIQKVIARKMMESRQGTAAVTAMAEVRCAPALTELGRLRESIPGLTLTHMLIKAVATCLRDHPRLNASLRDDVITEIAEINISLAVSSPNGELLLVVIRDADTKGLDVIASEARTLQERAISNQLRVPDVSGGTFTLSNYGMLQTVIWSTPIITPGQVGVLGAGRAAPRAVVGKDGGLVADVVLPLSLTYDHRVINGVPAGRYLDAVAEHLQTGRWES